MARRYGPVRSITAAVILFCIILASYHTLQPLRHNTDIVVEPESQDVVKQDPQEEKAVPYDIHDPEKQERKPADPLIDNPNKSKTLTKSTSTESQGTTETTQTTSTSATPTITELSKVIVIGRLSTEDTDWVDSELSDWQHAIYYVDLEPDVESPTGLRTKMNKAREAMPYLTFIIDNYPKFPDVMAFIHPHRRGMPQAWHTDAKANDAVNMMRDLKLQTVIDRGYVNLRCNNEVGCPEEVQPFREPPDPDKHAEHAYPYVYAHFFNATFETMRENLRVVATPCCAQFALSRAQILKKPKYEYERYRKFLEETHYDDATSGRVMEYMWHIIFDREAVHCENMFDCWCAVYGRCFRNGGHGF